MVTAVRRETGARHRVDEVRLVAMPLTSSSCPPSTSRAARPSSSSRAWPAPRSAFGDPVEAALRWQEAGAEWIHLVDLDAAFGRGHNRELLASIVGRLDVQVELSGGIRDDESLAAAMATGCRRVNIGTAALEQPEWCAGRDRDVRRPGRGRARRPRPHPRGPRLDPRGRRPLRGAGPARRRGLRALRRHRREQGRHAPGPQPPAAARRLRRHRPAGRRQRRHHRARRPRGAGRAGRRTASRARSSGRRSTRAGSRSTDALALTRGGRR